MPKHIPSFVWGGTKGWQEYRLEEALKVAERVKGRRGKVLTSFEKDLLREIFKITAKERSKFLSERN